MKKTDGLNLEMLQGWKQLLLDHQEDLGKRGKTKDFVAIDKQLDILEKYILNLEQN